MVVEKSLRKSLTSMSTASRNIRCRVLSRSAALQNQTMQGLTCCFLVELEDSNPRRGLQLSRLFPAPIPAWRSSCDLARGKYVSVLSVKVCSGQLARDPDRQPPS